MGNSSFGVFNGKEIIEKGSNVFVWLYPYVEKVS